MWVYVRGERANTYFKCGSCGRERQIPRLLNGTVINIEDFNYCSCCGIKNKFEEQYKPKAVT